VKTHYDTSATAAVNVMAVPDDETRMNWVLPRVRGPFQVRVWYAGIVQLTAIICPEPGEVAEVTTPTHAVPAVADSLQKWIADTTAVVDAVVE
jgi:hypothetical protein